MATNIKAVLAPGGGQSVAVTDRDGETVLFELVHDNLPGQGQSFISWIWSASVSPDGQYVATAGRDMTARLWDAATGKLVWAVTEPTGYVWSAAFSRGSRFLATAGSHGGGPIRLWDIRTGKKVLDVGQFEPTTTSPPGVSVRFAEDGRAVLANAKPDGTKAFPLSKEYWPDNDSGPNA